MKTTTEVETFYPENRQQWRKWLKDNHLKKQSVWLISYKKNSGKPTVSWSDSVDEALCFGWIDSKKISVDADTAMQFFSRRKKQSTWSKINKEKVARLTAEKLMMPAGLACIDIAKENGSWNLLDDVEELIIPKDLEKEFKARPGSKVFFKGLSRSLQKNMLQWLALAKRPETRQKRVLELAEMTFKKIKPPIR